MFLYITAKYDEIVHPCMLSLTHSHISHGKNGLHRRVECDECVVGSPAVARQLHLMAHDEEVRDGRLHHDVEEDGQHGVCGEGHIRWRRGR